MSHKDAVEYCSSQGKRLPTIRELFDFCAAGTAADSEGYFGNHRCGAQWLWSASVYSYSRNFAWLFFGDSGYVYYNVRMRYDGYAVRCVSGE